MCFSGDMNALAAADIGWRWRMQPTEPNEDNAPFEDHAPAEDQKPVEDHTPAEDPLIPAADTGAKTFTQ